MYDNEVLINPQTITSATSTGTLSYTNTATGVTQAFLDHGDGGPDTNYYLNLVALSSNYIGGNPNLIFKVQQAGDNGSGAPGTWIDSTQQQQPALNTPGMIAIGWKQVHRFSRVVWTWRGALAWGQSGNSSSLSAQTFSSSSSGGFEFLTIQGGLTPTYTN